MGGAFYNAVGPIIESHAPPSTRVILEKPEGAVCGGLFSGVSTRLVGWLRGGKGYHGGALLQGA